MLLSRLLRRFGLVMVCSAALAVAAAPQSEPLDPQVADAFGVRAGTVVSLELDLTPGVPTSIVVPIDGIDYTLDLVPHSVRDPDFVFMVQLADGSYVEKDPGPIRTLLGKVRELQGSEVAGSMLEAGIAAAIRLPDGDLIWIEPIASRLAGFDSDLHVIYADADVLPNGGVCGTRDDDAPAIVLDEEEGDPGTSSGGQIAQLACDADVEYFNQWGEQGARDRIQLVIHTMNFQYFRDVDILHKITTIIVRTSEPDPYSSSSCGTLLNQFTNRWRNFEPERSIKRDAAQLFTNKNLVGCVGIAWRPGMCSPSFGYSVVESDCCGGLSTATDLSAHELAHNWNAGHCNCPGWTMHNVLQGANRFHPNFTIPGIVNYRNSRFCLDKIDVLSLPFTDEFPDDHIDSFKWSNGVGVFSSSNGQNPPSPPFAAQLDRTDVLESHAIDTSGVNPGASLRFSFWTEERFAEANDFFFAEYWNSSGVWTVVFTEEGDEHGNQDNFDFHEFSLPDDAKHADFKIRFRTSGSAADFWYVDDVEVSAGASEICIIHGNEDWVREDPGTHVAYDDWAFSAYIDPKVESTDGVSFDLGKDTFNVVFSREPFGDAGGGPITVGNVSVEETGAGPAPGVVSATKSGNAISVVLDRIITLSEWTTLVFHVFDGDGVQIVDNGNEGEGIDECARLDVGFQPGDVNNSGTPQPLDLSRWITAWNAGAVHPSDVSKGIAADYTDISRNDLIQPSDLTREIAALKGQAPFTQNWRNVPMNNTQP